MKVDIKPIKMKSITDYDGSVIPYQFKIVGKDESELLIEVLRINSIEETKMAGVKRRIYKCEIILNDRAKPCELRYTYDTCYWELYKI